MTTHQHNPNRAGMSILRDCETFRKVLMANIHPLLPLETKIEAKVKILAMDYNELRASVIALNA